MEIEAKFAIANRQDYRTLLRVRTVAGFAVAPVGHVKMADRYYDTKSGRLLDAGYTCRIRTDDKGILVTLKGLGGAKGALHRRDEREVRLPAPCTDPNDWPAGEARELAMALSAGEPLQPLFDLEQDRARAEVRSGERVLAELSLDEVRAVVGRRPAFYYELEVELLSEGTEAELEAIAAGFQSEHGLAPEPRSKFERALAVLRTRGAAVQGRLDEDELGRIQAYLNSGNVELSRRAGAVLGWAEGLPTREIVARTGLSSGRIRFWLREWRTRRMDIFQDGVEGAPDRAARRTGVVPSPESAAGALQRPPQLHDEETVSPKSLHAGKPKSGLPTVAEFAAENGVNLVHAAHVADLSMALFDGLRSAHRLPKKRRKLLRNAALLAGVGAQQDPQRPHRAGRDVILAQPLHDIDTADRLVLACIVAFQREKVKPEREVAMQALAPKQRQHALALAALLQMAEALDASRTATTRIESIEDCDAVGCEVRLAGQQADVDALQATQRSGLWQHLTGRSVSFVARRDQMAGEPGGLGAPLAAVAATPPPAIEIPPMRADEPMSEAGRKTLLTHFLKMLANEAGTRLGADIEALHDMRVATRRMRAAYRLFAPYFEPDTLDQFNKDLRRAGRMLGAVRDLDVLLEAAEQHQAAAEGSGNDIRPLLNDWHTRRDLARLDMLDYLNSNAYKQFVDRFRTFLTTPGAGQLVIPEGEPRPHQVRHVAPRVILERYEVVRAYEPIIATAPLTTYHALRIEFKGLRYALEFFREVLSAETADLIKQITAMQDVLGALQDAHVAETLIAEFLEGRGRRRRKETLVALTGVESYLELQRARQVELLTGFPAPWAEVTGRSFRRTLALAVAAP